MNVARLIVAVFSGSVGFGVFRSLFLVGRFFGGLFCLCLVLLLGL